MTLLVLPVALRCGNLMTGSRRLKEVGERVFLMDMVRKKQINTKCIGVITRPSYMYQRYEGEWWRGKMNKM